MWLFDTPLREAALGVLALALIVLAAALILRRPRWRAHVLVLVSLAVGLVMLSNALR